MAELILNRCDTRNGSGSECYFDFEPGNEVILEAIESFLAKRSLVTEVQAGYLAELCAESFNGKESVRWKTVVSRWIASFLALCRSIRGTGGDRAKTGRKPGNGLSSGESRRRLSFA